MRKAIVALLAACAWLPAASASASDPGPTNLSPEDGATIEVEANLFDEGQANVELRFACPAYKIASGDRIGPAGYQAVIGEEPAPDRFFESRSYPASPYNADGTECYVTVLSLEPGTYRWKANAFHCREPYDYEDFEIECKPDSEWWTFTIEEPPPEPDPPAEPSPPAESAPPPPPARPDTINRREARTYAWRMVKRQTQQQAWAIRPYCRRQSRTSFGCRAVLRMGTRQVCVARIRSWHSVDDGQHYWNARLAGARCTRA